MSGERRRDGGGRPRLGPPRGGPAGLGLLEKPKDFKGTFRRLTGYLRPHLGKTVFVFVLAILSTAFGILSPRILGMATTELYESIQAGRAIDFAHIGKVLLALGILYVLSAVFSFGQQFVMAGVAQKTVYDMRREIKHKLSRLPLKYYDARTHGEILSRVTNDVDTISRSLQQSLTQLITSVVTLVGIVIMMLTISPLLTLVIVLVLPVAFVLTRTVTKRSRKYFAGQQKNLGDLNGHVEEMLTGHKIIKVFGRENESVRKFEEVNNKLYNSAWKAQFISGLIMPMMNFLNNIGFVVVCAFGGVMVTRGAMALGDLQAMIHYSRHFTQPITQTASIANILQATMAAAERVFEVLDEAEEVPENPDAPEIDAIRGDVSFEGVQFGYKEDDLLYEDLDINVHEGQTVAIVGPTGAGKTTLVNLLLRFYDVGDGRITVDGVDIRELTREDLRQIFGMVLQDTWLFNGTIRDNIAYGRLDASEEEVVQAAVAARADHFIRTLPGGYNTLLNEEASNISQGEKQLLTIARAILADPAILILDEATSSVDTRTEVLIQKAMAELMQGRTSFVIAHRLSTIRNADLILVMNEGQIIEQGTHEGLLAKNGFYAELYNSQFAG
ncbi:MAG: ABC transporter ATP-binding protein [Eubacteriales bacterium]|nr:ABC transporter ATP-binding protein [Eubacteriales bacterium]